MILALALVIGLPIASQGQSTPSGVTIRWDVDPSGAASAVSVVGLKPEVLKALQESSWTADRWSELLAVMVQPGGLSQVDNVPILGAYRIEGDSLRFTPRYPFLRGLRYQATFKASKLPGTSAVIPPIVSSHVASKLPRPLTTVTRVTPSSDRVPENLLKFYLYFSSPMSRGQVYDRVRLLKADGKAVDLPFLRLAEELWDPTGTRLTLLIDPGRIKQGLKPREEFGPVLEAGKTYTLVIDPTWLDAGGDPLGQEVRKTFRAEAPDERQPDPKTWTIARPVAATRDALTVTFPEPLDRALIESALTLVDAKGEEVAGQLAVEANETRWKFTPESPWAEGEYTLLIDAELEDLAGNNIRRPFEVDIQRDTPARPEVDLVRLPIAILPKGR